MRHLNHREPQREIEEEINEDSNPRRREQSPIEETYGGANGDHVDPADTQTSEFYQIPSQGGIPV